MPQMAPMNWVMLYIMFTSIFIFVNFLNYYIYAINSPSKKFKKYIMKSINWKW